MGFGSHGRVLGFTKNQPKPLSDSDGPESKPNVVTISRMPDSEGLVTSVTFTHDMASNHHFREEYKQVVHLGDFHCTISADNVVGRPTRPFEDGDVAYDALEPYLVGWALRSRLQLSLPVTFGRGGFNVRSADGSHVVGVAAVTEKSDLVVIRGVVTTNRIPVPEGPPLVVTEEVLHLAARWTEVVDGKERLLVGANWVLTFLERFFGSRADAAKGLNVGKRVLGNLGELCDQNDPTHGRKAKRPEIPLSLDEVEWIRELVPQLILRLAEVESQVTVDQITMADLRTLGQRSAR